ncbi:MAG: hypothetical protein N3D84_02545 [Candidatus Woesearchaeota archaeon]|nr:hypothetical protein [Candidatus Woesearchaeota archaeon]
METLYDTDRNNELYEGEKFSQRTLKFVIRHLANAAKRQKEREEKISTLESQITLLKEKAISGKVGIYKKKMESEFDMLQENIRKLINEERILVLNQKRESEMLQELKERLDLLEEKVLGLGHVHSMTAREHFKRIEELHRMLNRVAGTDTEKDYSAGIEKKIKKEQEIKKIEQEIAMIEKKHNELMKKGHPKEHLKKLKDQIEEYKKKLERLRKT